MWPRTDFLELTGIIHPIVLAPMSSFTTPALATSGVSNAGGLGSLGTPGLSADAVREQVTQLRVASNQPFKLKFFVYSQLVAYRIEEIWTSGGPVDSSRAVPYYCVGSAGNQA